MVRTSSPVEPESPAGADDGRTTLDRLAALELFSELEPAELAQLARGTRHRRLSTGESLWLTGEQATFFAVVEAGVVEIRQMTPTGEGVVVGLFRTGETIGLSAALEHGFFPADAIALGGAVDLLTIRSDVLQEALAGSVALARVVNRALLQHTAALRAKIGIVSAGSMPRRLAVLMVYLIERFGRTLSTGAVAVDLNLTP